MADKNYLPFLLLRPKEPVFMVKGGGDGVIFKVPINLLADRYKDVATVIGNFSDKSDHIFVNGNIKLPDLSKLTLGRESSFTTGLIVHQRYVNLLADIFMKARSIDELQSLAVYARDRVNPYLFNYAFSLALMHRPDTKRLKLPLLYEVFPGKFFDSTTFIKLREEMTVSAPELRTPIVIPRESTSNSKEPEHVLWYFREDVGINLHHWHWHMAYPSFSDNPKILVKDRRGEIFYYTHQQINARYNFERLCNKLPRVVPFNDFRGAIKEGYFPKLHSEVSFRGWPGRVSESKLKDVNREEIELHLSISAMEKWHVAITEAIKQGFVVDSSGNMISLDNEKGIDILGNIIWATKLSVNQENYGSIHNVGHMLHAYIHDPDGRHLESFGVLGDLATSMRDPAFFTWHAYIDDLFQLHKETLQPYSAQQLTFSGVEVTSIQVQTEKRQPNFLQTFWQQSDINLTNGLDFAPRGNAFVRFTHLMHDPFTYTVMVINNSNSNRKGVARIFMAPKFTETGERFPFSEQRRLMIELDRFVVALTPGENVITRKSIDSNVTISFEKMFRRTTFQRGPADTRKLDWCGCGWPNYAMIPKGSAEGFPVELSVMVSNYEEDKVDQKTAKRFSNSFAYCGLQDRKYPDKRAMGYPFDRSARDGIGSLEKFLTSNMQVQTVTIAHNDKRVETKMKLL